jgi:hypothetical protein
VRIQPWDRDRRAPLPAARTRPLSTPSSRRADSEYEYEYEYEM